VNLYVRRFTGFAIISLFCYSTSFASVLSDATRIKSFVTELVRYSDVSNKATLPSNLRNLKKTVVEHVDVLTIYLNRPRFMKAVRFIGLQENDVQEIEQNFGSLVNVLRTANPLFRIEKVTRKIIKMMPLHAFLQVALNTNHIIENQISIKEQEALKKLNDPVTGIDLSALPEKIRHSFNHIIENYFDHLALCDKRTVMLGVLELPIQSDWDKIVGAVLNSSGPVIQKLFQLIGNDTKSEKLKEILNQLKSNIKPMSDAELNDALIENFGMTFNDIFISFKRDPLAAASIGQVHLATLRSDGQEVIVKIQRPGLDPIVNRAFSTLESLALEDPILKNIIGKLKESIVDELDFGREAKSMELGKGYDDAKKNIHAVRRIDIPGIGKKVLIMEVARGVNLDKVPDTAEAQCLRGTALQGLLSKWAARGMLGDGFYHGDLHAGNMFLDVDPESSTFKRLTLIDFGNAATLNPQEKENTLLVMLGGVFNSYTMIESTFAKFGSDLNDAEKENLRAYFTELKESDLSYLEVMDQFGAELVSAGIDLPKNLIMFNRGRVFLEKQMREAKDALEKYPEYQCDLMRPEELYVALGIRRYPVALLKTLLGFGSSPKLGIKTAYRITESYFAPKALSCAKEVFSGTMPVSAEDIRYGLDFACRITEQ
jgi:predicted unusual protein kinase regulating ubiquinone biosynthesis (AarF/ABC1/UbiB family)